MDISSAPTPPLNGLRAFDAAGRYLNFRLAAEELGVTQGAVAQQVRGLEAFLGVTLLDRLPRGLRLTENGLRFHAEISRAFDIIRNATQTLQPKSTHLTISVTPTFAAKWLIPRLPDFTAENPHIDLRIVATEKTSNFHSDGVDLAVRQTGSSFAAGLSADFLFAHDIVSICSPALQSKFGQTPDINDLDQLVLIHDSHNLWPEYLELVFGRKISDKAKAVRLNQTSLAIDAALSGQGIALASRFLVENDLKEGRLVQPFAETLHGGSDFHLVIPRQSKKPDACRQVRQWMLSQARRTVADK
ncbi:MULTISPECIES: LysR substrate-binding domain-containing protein [Thalassospira]|uniref:LysR family transcriptional regulator n=1 Tax=Thalassospira profundimaris TaxID=502049 RepID=A0A367VGY5_9PROT|nr:MULTISPECIES: LysR substrate-binding domain-containing protein [Thalassospira]KZB71272.1 LysR family transcriptional regulator [Thalassospira sp. MCCC 1A01148]RCK24423.1 LysR family transcriptional regulator [Thalassospira profundimaris]